MVYLDFLLEFSFVYKIFSRPKKQIKPVPGWEKYKMRLSKKFKPS